MKVSAFLIIILVQVVASTIHAAKKMKLRSNMVNESEEEVKREEFQLPLLAKIVPNVVNPAPALKPPDFSAVIHKNNEILGSGAILNKHYVITLCTLIKGDKDAASSLKIVHPVFNVSSILTIMKNVTASHVELHPDCGDKVPNPAKNIGLIRTTQPMEHITYPKLPTIHIPPEQTKFLISSFRIHNLAATTIETTFWYIITRQVENSMCAILFQADEAKYSPEGNLCMAYYHLGAADNCKGDVGAPLTIRYQDSDTLVGLILHKHDCGHPKEAASFVCIRTNKEWIEKIIKT